MKILILSLMTFYCGISLASVHYSNLNVTIINNSPDNYLFLTAEKKQTNIQSVVNYPKPAMAKSTTINAFLAERSLIDYDNLKGLAPEGTFSYINQQDGNICSFVFNSLGVTLLNQNNHCSVSNETISTVFKTPYQWNAFITIS